jgi:hypothetical protein
MIRAYSVTPLEPKYPSNIRIFPKSITAPPYGGAFCLLSFAEQTNEVFKIDPLKSERI